MGKKGREPWKRVLCHVPHLEKFKRKFEPRKETKKMEFNKENRGIEIPPPTPSRENPKGQDKSKYPLRSNNSRLHVLIAQTKAKEEIQPGKQNPFHGTNIKQIHLFLYLHCF